MLYLGDIWHNYYTETFINEHSFLLPQNLPYKTNYSDFLNKSLV